ncbi:MAG: 3'-5' exonuclease [Paracoccaceae bacterium]
MKNLSLRLRVFLFFCLIGMGSIGVTLCALLIGFRQLADPNAVSSFATSAIVAGFGISGLSVFIWLLFDENVSKPIEKLAASLRVRAHADVETKIDESSARYLGDLAPAAVAINQKLSSFSQSSSESLAEHTEQLEQEKRQLIQILSDIPVATIVATTGHQIVLYDGQAASIMEVEAPARLNGSVFDYFDKTSVQQALDLIEQQGTSRCPVVLSGRSGAVYSGHIRQFGAKSGYTLMLESLDPEAERPLTYDFDLFDKTELSDLNAAALRDLTYVVFDSETTGLHPEKDEVVQIGAVRVVNCKCIAGEVFESLVNPGIPIPIASTKVHRIDNDMVANAPDFSEVCGAFHGFARDAVIVAHNAPFDMAFLHRQSKEIGLLFDHAVLDTVHLSAVVFGGSAEHTLDALCERLDVIIPPDMRHTAMGDAVATAEVFIRMLSILEARGICSFAEVSSEIRKHTRILKDANESS